VGGEDRPTGFSVLFTESHPRELFLEFLALGRICRFRKAIGQRKEPVLFRFFGLDPGFNQIHEHAIGADLARPCDGAHVFGDAGRNRDALANGLFGLGHMVKLTPLCTIMHQRVCGTR
jgi:hypothetical protein